MKPSASLAAFALAAALSPLAPTQAATVLSSITPLSTASASVDLLSSVGFVRGSQAFSDALNITTPGTLSVTLASVPWLDTLQNLNCFVSAPGGKIIGSPSNNGFETVDVGAGTIYVNWSAQASGPLSLGAYSIDVRFSPAVAPVPLPGSLILLLSGLGVVGSRFRTRPLQVPGS